MRKIVWALDPFSKGKVLSANWHAFVNGLAQAHKAVVEPVYVLSPDGLNWSGEFSGPWTKRYEPMAKAAAHSHLQGYAPKVMGPLKVLINQQVSLRKDVAKVVSYASRQKAEMIIVQTQGRKGLERLVLGSFAESMLLQSKVPVLAIHPTATVPTQVRRVLFPTDLSNISKKAFKKVLKFCKLWGAELVIAHKLPDPLEPIVQSGVYMAGGGWISLAEFYEKSNQKARAELEKLKNEAIKTKVNASVMIFDKPGMLVDSILKSAAVPGIDLIAMSSSATGVSSVLIGSVARQVVRAANVPVLVLHV